MNWTVQEEVRYRRKQSYFYLLRNHLSISNEMPTTLTES